MAVEVDLRIANEDWRKRIGDLAGICQRALDAGLAQEAATDPARVDVLLTDNAEMHMLNKTWRGKDKPTDVLSFPAGSNPDGFLGDIAIGFGVAAEDAARADKSLDAHLSHLLIHGLLHLFGHDHIEDEDAQIMETLERKALSNIGYDDPYSQIAPN